MSHLGRGLQAQSAAAALIRCVLQVTRDLCQFSSTLLNFALQLVAPTFNLSAGGFQADSHLIKSSRQAADLILAANLDAVIQVACANNLGASTQAIHRPDQETGDEYASDHGYTNSDERQNDGWCQQTDKDSRETFHGHFDDQRPAQSLHRVPGSHHPLPSQTQVTRGPLPKALFHLS